MSVLDRREQSRFRGWFAARVEGNSDGAYAVAQNVSEDGVLLVSRRRLPLGRNVQVSLHVDPVSEPPWILSGMVVRSHVNKADPHGLWPYKVAIEFARPMPELVDSLLATS